MPLHPDFFYFRIKTLGNDYDELNYIWYLNVNYSRRITDYKDNLRHPFKPLKGCVFIKILIKQRKKSLE